VPNQLQIFSGYSSPTDTALTDEMRRYLDAVAEYLKQNPRAEVRIVGHSDNFGGSPAQTQRVSDERALQVVRYLLSKGIPRERLLASGLGARSPIQSNRTPQGRAANRRVEITIVQ
jgi:outer membrane protein OmpA-like peptidoglycan-associated protein